MPHFSYCDPLKRTSNPHFPRGPSCVSALSLIPTWLEWQIIYECCLPHMLLLASTPFSTKIRVPININMICFFDHFQNTPSEFSTTLPLLQRHHPISQPNTSKQVSTVAMEAGQPTKGAIAPPTDMTPNFVNPDYVSGGIVPISIVCLFFSSVLLTLRIYTKIRLVKVFRKEDCKSRASCCEGYLAYLFRYHHRCLGTHRGVHCGLPRCGLSL